MEKTIGLSPKAWIPALAQFTAGLILILVTDFDVEGKTLMLAAVAMFTAGYFSPPGVVMPPDYDVVSPHADSAETPS